LCWMPGQETGFHDHDGAAGAVAVVAGEVVEQRLRLGAEPRRRTAGVGDAFTFDGSVIHNVGHSAGTPAVTVHAYSPRLVRMGVWRSPKPVIAQVHGWCVGGGSDFALCADLVIASEDARIGTPYSRMWGAYLSGMWIYRLGLAKAKHYALTGRPLSGVEAAACGLINRAVPFADLESVVADLASDLARIPSSQLAAMKLI